mgnify:CR=1 FL=1
MDREELKNFLPHREPMLLVDEINIDSEGVAHAKYLIREDEFFCRGHFPGNPLVPGVIQCEIMAQSCAMLVKDEIVGKTTLYSGIDNVRFKRKVVPGDTMHIEAHLTEPIRRGIASMVGKIFVGGQLACEATLMAQIVKNKKPE